MSSPSRRVAGRCRHRRVRARMRLGDGRARSSAGRGNSIAGSRSAAPPPRVGGRKGYRIGSSPPPEREGPSREASENVQDAALARLEAHNLSPPCPSNRRRAYIRTASNPSLGKSEAIRALALKGSQKKRNPRTATTRGHAWADDRERGRVLNRLVAPAQCQSHAAAAAGLYPQRGESEGGRPRIGWLAERWTYTLHLGTD